MVLKLFSFDVLTNGPWGQGFSVGAAVYENGHEFSYFLGRCPIEGTTDSFVAQNVIPQMECIPETHESYEAMLRAFAEYYLKNKKNADIIVHMGLPAEVKLLLDMHRFGFIRDLDAPYPLIDIAGNIQQAGFRPTSLEGYNSSHFNVVPPCKGGIYSPLYQARAAAICYFDLMAE